MSMQYNISNAYTKVCICVCITTQTFLNRLSTLRTGIYIYPVSACMILDGCIHILIHYYIIAKSSVDIDCELEILYSNTAHVYV